MYYGVAGSKMGCRLRLCTKGFHAQEYLLGATRSRHVLPYFYTTSLYYPANLRRRITFQFEVVSTSRVYAGMTIK